LIEQIPERFYGTTPLAERTHYSDATTSRIAPIAIAIFTSLAAGAIIGFAIAAVVGACAGAAIAVAITAVAIAIFSLYKETCRYALVGPYLPADFIANTSPHPDAPKINKVLYYPTGKQSTEAKFHLLESAKQSIELSANFAGGAHLDRLLDIFKEKLRDPNFKIHFIVSEDLITKEQQQRITKLNTAHPESCHILVTARSLNHHRDTLSTTENHAKMVLVDGSFAIVGDSGIQDFYDHQGDGKFDDNSKRELSLQTRFKERFLGRATKSADLLIHGPLATQMRESYFRLHAVLEKRTTATFKKRYFPLDATKPILDADTLPKPPLRKVSNLHFFGSDPDCPYNSITKEYVRLIQTAKKTITICNMEFSLVPELRSALEQAKKNNPKLTVTLITNGKHPTSPGSQELFVPANRMHYSPDVIDTVCEFKVHKTLLHQKAMLVDGKSWVIGSYNISPKSAYYDYESAVSGTSRNIGAQFKRDFDKMLQSNKAHTLHGNTLSDKAKLGIVGRRLKPVMKHVIAPCFS
jgi:phosphatidylserine/phosphatidylglycerophosphate/cardiolipin synthase-like enzyme